MSDLPERYGPHSQPELVICIECSGNPAAVLPLAAVPQHEEWHALISGPGANPNLKPGFKAQGEWPLARAVAKQAIDARLDAARRFLNAPAKDGLWDELPLVMVEELGSARVNELLDEAERRAAK